MEVIRAWIVSVTVSAMVIAAAEALMPDGAVKKVGKLTGGLILILGILQPLVTMDYEDLYDLVNTLPAGAISQQRLEETSLEPMKTIIEEELAAYIVDKGARLGAACTAQVVCAPGEGGLLVPLRATVTGKLSDWQKGEMIRCLEEDLDLPREAQIYRNEETP